MQNLSNYARGSVLIDGVNPIFFTACSHKDDNIEVNTIWLQMKGFFNELLFPALP